MLCVWEGGRESVCTFLWPVDLCKVVYQKENPCWCANEWAAELHKHTTLASFCSYTYIQRTCMKGHTRRKNPTLSIYEVWKILKVSCFDIDDDIQWKWLKGLEGFVSGPYGGWTCSQGEHRASAGAHSHPALYEMLPAVSARRVAPSDMATPVRPRRRDI